MPREFTDAEWARVEADNPRRNANESVPSGHRAKCRKCGAVDTVKTVGIRRLKRCGACGSTLAMRRAPRKPKVISWVVCMQLNGVDWNERQCVDLSLAETVALTFVESGPVARVRIAQIVELMDNERTGNVRTLRYDNFRQRRSTRNWVSGCEVCKGRGLIFTLIRPAHGEVKAAYKSLPCVACNALGGELTKAVMFPRVRRHK